MNNEVKAKKQENFIIREWKNGLKEVWWHLYYPGTSSAEWVTVTFPKPFSDTQYNVLNGFFSKNSTDSTHKVDFACDSRTTTSIKIYKPSNTGGLGLYICGY